MYNLLRGLLGKLVVSSGLAYLPGLAGAEYKKLLLYALYFV